MLKIALGIFAAVSLITAVCYTIKFLFVVPTVATSHFATTQWIIAFGCSTLCALQKP